MALVAGDSWLEKGATAVDLPTVQKEDVAVLIRVAASFLRNGKR